jgi:hypothetical protein
MQPCHFAIACESPVSQHNTRVSPGLQDKIDVQCINNEAVDHFDGSESLLQPNPNDLQTIIGYFQSLTPPAGNGSMLDVFADIIAGGSTDQELVDMCRRCDQHGVAFKLEESLKAAVPSRLSPSHVAVFGMYTIELSGGDSPYRGCNSALRDCDPRKCKPFVPFIWHLLHAMAKCDRYDGNLVYRGIQGKDLSAQHPRNSEIMWPSFSSCSSDLPEHFIGSSGTRTMFNIELTSGRARSIAKFSLVPSEGEVLLPPNSRFKVMSHMNAGNGLLIIQLKELPPTEPILDFDSESFVSPLLQSSSQTQPIDQTSSQLAPEDARFEAAYKEALKSSGRPFPFTQLCLVGEGRAGKTALANSLCGRAFVQTDSTIGVGLERMQVSQVDLQVSAAGC